jgi:hypothetical protein
MRKLKLQVQITVDGYVSILKDLSSKNVLKFERINN